MVMSRWKKIEEARWAARSGPVTIVRPARGKPVPDPEWKLDGLDLARAQYTRYKIKPKITIAPTS